MNPQLTITKLSPTDLLGVAALHFRLFGDPAVHGYSMATLGREFLERTFYPLNLENPHFCCDVARVDDALVGFSVYTTSKDEVFRFLLRRRFFPLARASLGLAVRRPSTVPALLGNVRYLGGERPRFLDGVSGWWIVAGVAPEYREKALESRIGGSIAPRLFDRMEERMRTAGCDAWYGVVHPDNVAINVFLERRGARIAGSAMAQGKSMRYYTRRFRDPHR